MKILYLCVFFWAIHKFFIIKFKYTAYFITLFSFSSSVFVHFRDKLQQTNTMKQKNRKLTSHSDDIITQTIKADKKNHKRND